MVLYGEFTIKFPKGPKTKLMPKTAKPMYVPYILSYFFTKMLLFDVDLSSPCFDMESPCYNGITT